MLTMEDAFLNRKLQPENLSNLTWVAHSDLYSYTAKKNDVDYLIICDAKGVKRDTIMSAAYFKNIHKDMSDKSFPHITWLSADSFYYSVSDKTNLEYEVYHLSTKKENTATKLSVNSDDIDIANNTLSVAYTWQNNLYMATRTNSLIRITNDNEQGQDIVNGKGAHRQEFGITKGTFWSPAGNAIAFYRIDQSKVMNYPLVDISERPTKDTLMKYPMAGSTSQSVTVGVYNVTTQKLIFLKTGEPYEQYLTNITWSPDGKQIYISVLNRDQNHMWLNKYDAITGDFIKTLFEEKDDKYVEPLNPLMFVSGHDNEFLFLSQRDGYTHFYLYNTDGKLIRQVTKGNWAVTDFLGMDEKGKYVYYVSTEGTPEDYVIDNSAPNIPAGHYSRPYNPVFIADHSPIDRQVYRIELNSGKVKALSKGAGMHYAFADDVCSYIIDGYSNISIPRELNIIDASGKIVNHLLTASNPLKDYKIGHAKIFTMKANDGKTDLYCRMITPPDFDSTKKYPAVVYLYGGPHVQLVTNSWLGGANLWMELMAEKGYIIFTMDSRGSGNRGLAFEQTTFRNLGTVEMEDQITGAKFLKNLPYVDSNRVGVHGWSFGGFMTTSLMTRYPGVFKVAVAGGPVIDWKYYEVMYTERYMDTPEQNPEGYDKADVLNYVKNLKGRLLVIHGTVDPVVVWQHSLMFLRKCIDEGKQVDYFVYPGDQHNMFGKDRVHLYTKVTQYFDDFLK